MPPLMSTVLRAFGAAALVLVASLTPGRAASAQATIAALSCRAAPGAEASPAILARWLDDVWLQGRMDVVPELVGPTYVRHEGSETRTVTPAQYVEEITAIRQRMPDVRFMLHDCAAIGDRIWSRWTMVGTSAQTGQRVRRMATQIYRIASGRLVETWMLMLPADAAWPEQQDTSGSSKGS
jgi:predicted ester cyclase